MIEGIVKVLGSLVGRKIGTKIGENVSTKQALKKVTLDKHFQYTMKNVRMFLFAGVFFFITGIGFTLMGLYYMIIDELYNGDTFAALGLGIIASLMGTGFIIRYKTYRISYTNTLITKKTEFKEDQIRWNTITKVYVNNKNCIVLQSMDKEIVIKTLLVGIHDFLYIMIEKLGKGVIYPLSQNEMVYKKLRETMVRYEIELGEAITNTVA